MPPADLDERLPRGTVLGDYEIEQLGRGAMVVVRYRPVRAGCLAIAMVTLAVGAVAFLIVRLVG